MVNIKISVFVFFSYRIMILWSILKFSVCFLLLWDYNTMINIKIPMFVVLPWDYKMILQ